MGAGMAETLGGWWPLVFILLAGALPTYIWRGLGVVFAGRIREDSEFLRWVKAVATTLIAGVIARLVIFPSGALVDVPLGLRLVALAGGFGVAFLPHGTMFFGIVAGEAILVAGALLM